MYLLHTRLVGVGPFEDVAFPFADEEGQARMVTVVHGGGGVGKTTLLGAIATTRPGHAIVQLSRMPEGLEPRESDEPEAVPFSVCEWSLGSDDPERPHALRVASPNARISPDPELEALRRREQTLFERFARQGGFAFLAIGAGRWFSRQPIALSAPLRTIARYDVRTSAALDDASRSDLGRETKQALAYAAIASALATEVRRRQGFDLLGMAMCDAVDALCKIAGFSYMGVDPASFEPLFVDSAGRVRPFDTLPTRARHLVAFAALSVRTLWGAYPGRDPRAAEGVVAIDEVDENQDPSAQARLVSALREALPRVQWILTTTSPIVAASCDAREVLALRRSPELDRVELYTGNEAQTH
jgi:hypothetical protein